MGIIIDHIVKYQNNYVSAFLFRYNIIELMEKGIEIYKLLSSNVFTFQFEFDEWPATHRNLKKMIVPYNNSIFNIRESYNSLFDGILDDDMVDDPNDRYYKIKYSLNLLPFIKSNTDETFTQQCQEKKETELQIFKA
jgi:hypothetical protein